MEINGLTYHVWDAVPREEKIQANLLVFFLAQGSLSIRCQGEVTRMSRGDILAVNPGMGYEISGCRDALLGEAVFPVQFLTSILGKDQLLFYCNSVKDMEHSFAALQDIFSDLTVDYAAGGRKTMCFQYAQLFRILDELAEHFQTGGQDRNGQETEQDQRMRRMMSYIFSNLDQDISLNRLANEMFVSTSTLSRLFRRNTGMYFADYVTSLRVQMAMELLEHTNQNLTRISMSCGFINSSTFNRAFHKVAGMSPSEYRENYRRKEAASADKREEEEKRISRELQENGYLEGNPEKAQQINIDFSPESRENSASEGQGSTGFPKVWNEMINIGPIWDLMNANVQFHILYLHEQLHFQYFRVWNVFSRKMMIGDERSHGSYNYNLIDMSLDFLVSHRIKPFLDFGRRPDMAYRGAGDKLFYDDQYMDFSSQRMWENLVDDFLSHIVERYGLDEVSQWIFELSRDEENGEDLYPDEHYDYFDAFLYFYRSVRRQVPGAKFGGIGDISMMDWDRVRALLEQCREHQIQPDYISLSLFGKGSPEAYSAGDADSDNPASGKADLARMVQMRGLMQECGFPDMKLYVTEWNITPSNRNYLNDSCWRACCLIMETAASRGLIDMLGIMSGTDWVSNYVDSIGITNGGIGLLTTNRIRKPVFYAVDFLNRLGEELLGMGDDYIATRNEKGDLYLLFFYCKWSRENTCLGQENISPAKFSTMTFSREPAFPLDIVIRHLPSTGSYVIKQETLNHDHGSILDEWSKFSYDNRLGRDEVKYLQSVSIPTMSMQRQETEGEEKGLSLQIALQPDEVRLIHIYSRR